MGILPDAGRDQGGWSVFFECPAGKVLLREGHWLRVLLPAGVKFRVGCGPGLAACHRFRGGRAYEAGVDQGGFRAAEGPSQPLTVLHEAAGFGMRVLQDAGSDQDGWSAAEGPRQTPSICWQYC